jgi:uncharacterized protein (TIGR02678 family)
MTGLLLDADLAEVARILNAVCRIRLETDPGHYRIAVRSRSDLATFFRTELGWHLTVDEGAGVVRLHKRRADVPANRGPRVIRNSRPAELAPAKVLILACLVCEQLWRRPRMTLHELLQAIAQTCAAEVDTGRLPTFRVVSPDGQRKQEAADDRRQLGQALTLLVHEGTIATDADLDRAIEDENTDLVIIASRERLAMKFSSLSPGLLGLDGLPAADHVAALSTATLPVPTATLGVPPSVEERRLLALRRLVDDPAADPSDDLGDAMPYLHSISGRDRALTLVASLGLVPTVRRDWWEVTDPHNTGGNDFPNGRRTERQAALAVLAELPRRPDPAAHLNVDEISRMFEKVREQSPRWAAAYDQRFAALARAAAGELVAVHLLMPDDEGWLPTPGIHLWRVRAKIAEPGDTTRSRAATPPSAPDVLPIDLMSDDDDREGDVA